VESEAISTGNVKLEKLEKGATMKMIKMIWGLRASIFMILTSGCPFKNKGECLQRLFENSKGLQRE
jgi:hypothetical protein